MENNSCLLLNCTTYLPIPLLSVFEEEDLKDTGIELEPHITLLFAQGKELPRMEIMSDIEDILGPADFDRFIELIKEENTEPLLSCFELGAFENESGYIILKMKKQGEFYNLLSLINKGLRIKYGVKSRFPDYTPHITLAELQPGLTKKYLENETLQKILENSFVSFEDVVLSIGPSNTPVDRERYNLTTFNVVDYFFYVERSKREQEEFKKMI